MQWCVPINKAEVDSSKITEVRLELDGRFWRTAIEHGPLGLCARRFRVGLAGLHRAF